jgi:hypothetical protein
MVTSDVIIARQQRASCAVILPTTTATLHPAPCWVILLRMTSAPGWAILPRHTRSRHGIAARTARRFTYPLYFHTLPHSFAPLEKPTPAFSATSTLFAQNHPGGVPQLGSACRRHPSSFTETKATPSISSHSTFNFRLSTFLLLTTHFLPHSAILNACHDSHLPRP